MKTEKQQLALISVKPVIMPFLALILGLFVWVSDAVIDIYILGEEQDLLSNILMPDEPTELWMRVLVLVVFVGMGLFSRHVMIKHIKLDQLLLRYQQQLEDTVSQRTRELVVKSRQLELLAGTDPLTGLYNRRKFNSLLEHEIKRFERYGQPLSLLLIDIDHFKSVNDQYGHVIGDNVLIEFASILETNVRRTDSVTRWGGEEFLLLCIELDQQQACQLAEKIRKMIKQTDFEYVGKLTASIGIAQIAVGDTAKMIIKRADQALYAAKNSGRDRVVCHSEVDKVA